MRAGKKEGVLTALERKSRWAWVRGLERGAGFEAASAPDLGVREDLDWGTSWELERVQRRGAVERCRIERLARGSWRRLGARKS
jgi:hypothetical protein